MSDNPLGAWQRLAWAGRPVYVHPDRPDWFVPDALADGLLQQAAAEPTACDFETVRLLAQLAGPATPPYQGRSRHLALGSLKECWFHLTDRCNLACRHCLFAASPAAAASLDPALLAQGLRQARELGCTLFYFTGGEPFLYPEFIGVLDGLLAEPEVHAVVLTNGLLIEAQIGALSRLPRQRLHLQISVDGLEASHDRLRGKGAFARVTAALDCLHGAGIPATLSMAVNRDNANELPAIVELAAAHGVGNVHFLWHFVRGKGSREQFVPAAEIVPQLVAAQEKAEALGVLIDNVETLKAQVFATPGTRHDLSNAAWESVAIGPDGGIFPSPALIGINSLRCGELADGLEAVWQNSEILRSIRQASLVDSEETGRDPLRFLTGGGDIDHSFLAGGTLVGHDPYRELYNSLALWLIARQAERYPATGRGDIVLRMGDVRFDCADGREVALTHCNCVISLAGDRGHSSVREFYAAAALTANEGIVNPFAPAAAENSLIPVEAKKKSYGCGSPVHDADLAPGEVLVDLGSGSGVECFLAAEMVGPGGRVYGIDMTDEMLALARRGKQEVCARLGYDVIEFRKGFLEAIPLADACADAVISNCVINLSPDKRQTFHEIFRILKPGGRLVVSDIVTDEPIPATLKNDERLRGECLGGALPQVQLMAMLRAAGFGSVRLVKRFPYREEGGIAFYSLTFAAHKPAAAETVEVVYRGPFAAIATESGTMLLKGQRTRIALTEAQALDESVFVLDQQGAVANIAAENSCCAAPQPLAALLPKAPAASSCCGPSSAGKPIQDKIVPLVPAVRQAASRHRAGCMVCGSEISYLSQEREMSCHYCGGVRWTNAICSEGHYICDHCHQQDGLSAIRLICAETEEQDMLALLARIRHHPAIPMHGPEHHAMVPGIILATFRNRGGAIDREAILAGIERGSKVPGGVCGFWGNCGAAAGVGIAFSILLAATPLTPRPRQQAQAVTARVLARIAAIRAGRCCQRETVVALREAAAISEEILPIGLLAEQTFECSQWSANKECLRRQCPLWPQNAAAGRAPDRG